MAKKRPGPFALPPDRYPIGDLKHANLAITRLYMKTVTDAERRKVIAAIRKRYPKNEALKERIKKLQEKTGLIKKRRKKMAKKKKTTKKGNRRKGQPKGARLAYDDLKKKKRKTKKKKTPRRKKRTTRKKPAGLLEMLTSQLID